MGMLQSEETTASTPPPQSPAAAQSLSRLSALVSCQARTQRTLHPSEKPWAQCDAIPTNALVCDWGCLIVGVANVSLTLTLILFFFRISQKLKRGVQSFADADRFFY